MKYESAGAVESVNGSTGPASGITYNVRVNLPGSPSVLFSGVTPWRPRWPEDKVDTVPCPIGTPIDVLQFGTSYYFDIPEMPVVNECP